MLAQNYGTALFSCKTKRSSSANRTSIFRQYSDKHHLQWEAGGAVYRLAPAVSQALYLCTLPAESDPLESNIFSRIHGSWLIACVRKGHTTVVVVLIISLSLRLCWEIRVWRTWYGLFIYPSKLIGESLSIQRFRRIFLVAG